MSATREVQLPEALCAAAERQFGTSFQKVEDLLAFVLNELLREDSRRLDESDRDMIETRLRDLGYL